jgi:hypothetical protein
MIRRDSRVIVTNTTSVYCDRKGVADSAPGSDGTVAVRLDEAGTLWFETDELTEIDEPKPGFYKGLTK